MSNEIKSRYMTIWLGAFLCAAPLHAQATARAKRDCTLPAVLKITLESGGLSYDLDGKRSKVLTMGGLGEAVRDCSPERTLFIVIAQDVPAKKLSISSYEQVAKVRYFIQWISGDVEELVPGHMYKQIPISPDIKPEPDSDDSIHTPTNIPRTKGPQ